MSFLKKQRGIRGEVATTLTIVGVAIMAVGALVGSQLNRQTDLRSQAAGECVISGNPRLKPGGICEVSVVKGSTELVCALIDPSKPGGQQVVAGQDFPDGTKPVAPWNINNNIGTVQLHTYVTLDPNTSYRLVAYNFNHPTICGGGTGDTQPATDISGSDVVASFGDTGNNQHPPDDDPPPDDQDPPSVNPTCYSRGGTCARANQCTASGYGNIGDLGCNAIDSGSFCCGQTGQQQTPTCPAFTSFQDCTAAYGEGACEAYPSIQNCYRRKTTQDNCSIEFCRRDCASPNTCTLVNSCYVCKAPTQQVTQPTISFKADASSITAGSCTNVRWNVTNAKNIYFIESNGSRRTVTGVGSRQVCPTRDTIYKLIVISLDDKESLAQAQVKAQPKQQNNQPAPQQNFSNVQAIISKPNCSLVSNISGFSVVECSGQKHIVPISEKTTILEFTDI